MRLSYHQNRLHLDCRQSRRTGNLNRKKSCLDETSKTDKITKQEDTKGMLILRRISVQCCRTTWWPACTTCCWSGCRLRPDLRPRNWRIASLAAAADVKPFIGAAATSRRGRVGGAGSAELPNSYKLCLNTGLEDGLPCSTDQRLYLLAAATLRTTTSYS